MKKIFGIIMLVFLSNLLIADWLEQKMVSSDLKLYDAFGFDVAIDGDYAIIGAYNEGADWSAYGAAYVFQKVDGTWTQLQKITAYDAEMYDMMGYAVAISGDYIAVSSCMDDDNGSDSGSVYIYHRNGSTWEFHQKLIGTEVDAGDQFGNSLSMDGGYLVVGAFGDATGGTNMGAVYIFALDGTSWTQMNRLTAYDSEAWDNFGYAVAIDGDYILVGATGDDDAANLAGAAYVYYNSGRGWGFQTKIVPAGIPANSTFGNSVSLSGEFAVFGISNDDTMANNVGASYIYQRSGTDWNQYSILYADDAGESDCFGYKAAIDGNYIVVGAYYDVPEGVDTGSAYIFKYVDLQWTQIQKVFAADGSSGANFGYAVAISGKNVMVGAVFQGTGELVYSGAVYAYEGPAAGTGSDSGTPPDADPLAVDVEPLDAYDYDGNGAVVVDPDVDVNPDDAGATITVNIVVTVGNGDVQVPVNAALTYQVTVNGTSQPVQLVLHFTGLPFEPDELVWNNGGTRQTVSGVIWDYLAETATFSWTFVGPLRDGEETFVMNEGDGSTLPVELSSFAASVTASNTVMIEWTTQSESDMLGYNLLRSQTSVLDEAIQINMGIIDAQNSSTQTDYSFEDEDVTANQTYHYWLQSNEYDGSTSFFGPVTCTVTYGEEEPEAPEVVFVNGLTGNFPNPFNPSTTVSFSLANDSNVTMEIYNVRGQRVATLLHDSAMTKGEQSIVWDADGMGSGIYYARLTIVGKSFTHKMLLIK